VTLGVGDSDTNVVSAIVLQMTLDYVKMLIGLMFGGSARLVNIFVCNQKYFYLVSQTTAIVAVFLQIIAPIF